MIHLLWNLGMVKLTEAFWVPRVNTLRIVLRGFQHVPPTFYLIVIKLSLDIFRIRIILNKS